MNTKEYVTLQVERTRGQLRAAGFIRRSKNALRLRGKTREMLVADLMGLGKKPLELVDATAVTGEEPFEPMEGDIVSADHAFLDRTHMVWVGTSIRFLTADGAVVSPEQYEYLKEHKLGAAQIFAEAEGPRLGLRALWKSMTRAAREARMDKAKEIFYMTFGELVWESNPGKKEAGVVHSPLFILPVREETTSTGAFKLRLPGLHLKQNSVLRREVLKQTGVNIYEICPEDIPLSEIGAALSAVSETVTNYGTRMTVDADAFYLCILDSHDESVCQAVEKNLDRIAASPLTQYLSGEREAPDIAPDATEEMIPICPLPADESQRRVLSRVLHGINVHAPAPAGAGKSQTSVNIAANLAMQGKSVCVMSEKLAANEVFLDYASRIGLDQYCLSVDSTMKTADLVRQIKSIVKIKRQYVQTSTAKETIRRYHHARETYENLNHHLYETDPALDASLYELVTVAVSAPTLPNMQKWQVDKQHYTALRTHLLDLKSTCFDTMTDGEFKDYFTRHICRDSELSSMLEEALAAIAAKGLDLATLIAEHRLSRTEAVERVLASLAGKMAMDIIGRKNLIEVGNRRVKAVYKSLVETHQQMERLYASYMHQELSARIERNADAKFIATLEKLKVTKVTPQELFMEYGAEILALCPIIVTTPTAAANYIYGTGLDDCHTMIIDEASQMKIISILPYLDRIRQLVVFGDHMQLGITTTFRKADAPVSENAIRDTAEIDNSVLQAVQGRLPACALSYHYRSGTEMLIHVSNKTCYDGLLEVVPDTYTERKALPPHLGLEVIRVDPPDGRMPVKRGENPGEAQAIVDRVAELRRTDPDKSIGIIAFNEPQQELIADKLEDRAIGYVDDERLWVRSLENAQGKEADFIFVSIGHFRRTADGKLHMYISELNREGGENRLNVLFTRARCKNFIVLSFDYHELRRSENPGIRRLYEYIDYAAEGKLHETVTRHAGNTDHEMVRSMAHTVETLGGEYTATARIGSENMAVDVAIRRRGEPRYTLGIIMPAFGQTPQETLTKVMVLERAGWHLSPVSPIYFLTAPDAFCTQLARDLDEPVTFTGKCGKNFDTNRRPVTLFTLEDFSVNPEDELEAYLSPLTVDDFVAMDFESIYAGALSPDLLALTIDDLKSRAGGGDTEAHLLLLIRQRRQYIEEGQLRTMLSHVNRLYAVDRERRAAFLFAQLLRVGEACANPTLVKELFREAFDLGIGGD